MLYSGHDTVTCITQYALHTLQLVFYRLVYTVSYYSLGYYIPAGCSMYYTICSAQARGIIQ